MALNFNIPQGYASVTAPSAKSERTLKVDTENPAYVSFTVFESDGTKAGTIQISPTDARALGLGDVLAKLNGS